MLRSRSKRVALTASVIVPVALAGALVPVAGANAATSPVVRWASPTGTSSSYLHCHHASPCDIVSAINLAPAGAEVRIEAGSYYADPTAKSPLTAEIKEQVGTGLDIHGPKTAANRPVIYTAAYDGFVLDGSNLSDVNVVSSGTNLGVSDAGGLLSHVNVTSSSPVACADDVAIVDSLCIDTAAHGAAVSLSTDNSASSALSPVITGVTAEATGTGGIGLNVTSGDTTTYSVSATNDIIHGSLDDVVVQTTSAGGSAKVTVSHSDFATSHVSVASGGAAGSVSITTGAGNLRTAPHFRKASAGDFTETGGSPTVDAGVADPAGDTDLVGTARTVGGAPDMGAYEFLPKPKASGFTVGSPTAHTAGITVTVNPRGLATTLTVTATTGKKVVTTTATAGSGIAPKQIHLTLHGLQAHSAYNLAVVASSSGGTDSLPAKSLRTT